jgi:hypothetical protein
MTEDNAGVPITRKAFDELIRVSIRQMEEARVLNEGECISMVRIYNTVTLIPDSKRSDAEVEFLRRFIPAYLKQAVAKLDASLTKGMAYYSAKHDISIGGNPNHNSRFNVE